jgi:hypothetical protein
MKTNLESMLSDLRAAIDAGATSIALVIIQPGKPPQTSALTSPSDVPTMFLALHALAADVGRRPTTSSE